MTKLLILVLSSYTYPSYRNEKTLNNTWVKNKNKNVEIIFYKSGSKFLFLDNQLTVPAGNQTSDIGIKTIKAFEWANKNLEFDFVLRTNTSSYINIQNLMTYVNKININSPYLYNGIVMNLPKKINNRDLNFISGSGILLNRKTIQLILENKHNFDKEEWDDVAIGKLLDQNNVPATGGKRFDIKGNIFKQNIDLNHYHYRCRIDNHYGYPRFLEKYVIYELHNQVSNKNINKYLNLFLRFFFEFCRFFYIQSPFWKIYSLLKKILKILVPNKIFIALKQVFKNFDTSIKLKYTKK